MGSLPFVSVIVPCYREKEFIGKCLDSLLENDYPAENPELLVYDGGSTDGTRDIAEEYARKHPFVKLRDNPDRFTPFAMNKGIEE